MKEKAKARAAVSVKFQREVPVRHDVDVFVAGGGPAGCAAAVMAARQGARVFLAEGQNCFGGMGTAGLVPAFMQFGDGVNFLAAGFGEELLERLIAAGGTTVAAPGADRTGDGDLAAWAGAPFEKGDAQGGMMPGTLCQLWSGIDYEAVRAAGGGHQNVHIEKAFKDGVFTHCDKHLPGIWYVAPGIGGANVGHTFGVDATDERSLTTALVWGRKLVTQYERYYKEYLKGYERMYLAATGALLGVRETRRIMGDYVLCLNDFQTRASFADEIGRYCYPVDIHVARPDDEAEYRRFEKEFAEMRYAKGESYGIPYRCLVPQKLHNVLVAGRCVSTDRSLQASIRVMPGCYITGQAAGVAAALAAAATGEVRAVAVPELRQRLASRC